MNLVFVTVFGTVVASFYRDIAMLQSRVGYNTDVYDISTC